MATESRFNGTINAVKQAFYRLGVRIAALSMWQFVLLAIVLMTAAGITEGLWERPAKPKVRVVNERTTGAPGKESPKTREKAQLSAEIQIDEDGLTIRRKPGPGERAAEAAPAPQGSEKSGPIGPLARAEPGAQEKQASQPGSEGEINEIRIGDDRVTIRKRKPAAGSATGDAGSSKEDVALSDEDVEEIVRHKRQPRVIMITLLLVLALFVMRMFTRTKQRAEQKTEAARAVAERETLQRQVLEARLQLLQAQVEPHFLFNSLAAVEHLIETAPARAAKMQRHLIDYLRAAVPRMRQQSATLGQETGLCVSYLEIMQMRMEERLQFKVNVPAGLASASFPPMMLQSLIENSVRHGLEPKPEGGIIDLTAEVRDGKLCVIVGDTGLGFSPNARTGVGLANIRERLQQLFGAAGSLSIEPNQPCGTRATISVPYALP